jgi:hypothetical protein
LVIIPEGNLLLAVAVAAVLAFAFALALAFAFAVRPGLAWGFSPTTGSRKKIGASASGRSLYSEPLLFSSVLPMLCFYRHPERSVAPAFPSRKKEK